MIRKAVMLALVALLFVYTVWHFYAGAVAYDPLADVVAGKRAAQPEGHETAVAGPAAAWTPSIHENNAFSPLRTYRPPKPAVSEAAAQKPKRPDIVLKGIVLDRFGDYVAYIAVDKAKALAMRKGDKSGDVELKDVSDKRAVVKWYDEMIDLSLEKIKTIEPGKAGK